MFLLGSAYPTAKLGLNASIPPILFGSLRMAIVFICLLPFLKFQLPNLTLAFYTNQTVLAVHVLKINRCKNCI